MNNGISLSEASRYAVGDVTSTRAPSQAKATVLLPRLDATKSVLGSRLEDAERAVSEPARADNGASGAPSMFGLHLAEEAPFGSFI